VVVKSGKIFLDKKLYVRYLENTFFGQGSDENQEVEKLVSLCDFHGKDCSSKCRYRQHASAILACVFHQTTKARRLILLCKAEKIERWLENFYKCLMDAFSFIHLGFVNFCRVLFFSIFSALLIMINLYKLPLLQKYGENEVTLFQ